MTSGQHPSANDEIDLIELIHALWRQRLLIALFTVAFTLAALGYSYSVTPIYSSQAKIAPAPISGFGTLAGALNNQCCNQDESAFSNGISLANDTFDILIINLNSQIVRREFDAANPTYREVAFQVRRERQSSDPVSLIATGTDPELSKAFIDAFLTFATAATVEQINVFLKGMGVADEVSALYRLEQSAVVPSASIKPKRVLIITLGFILGGMSGVFIGLIRSMFAKCIRK